MKEYVTVSHWGPGVVEVENGRIARVTPHASDPDASPINGNIASSLNGRARILNPSIRKGWLEHGPKAAAGARGREPFVEVDWETANRLISGELTRVRSEFGNRSIFAGSYGWSSAGRFHHAQSQLKRFLNCAGGFVRSEGNYSYNAALVLMPHILGNYRDHVGRATRWKTVAESGQLVVMFGGMALRNSQVSDGGIGKHRLADNLRKCVDAGVRFVNLSPLRCDFPDDLNAEWLPPKPGSDTAVMMGIAHTLVSHKLHNRDFLDRYTTGYDRFEDYLMGRSDGIPKDCGWAAERSGINADRIAALALEMAEKRTLITCAAGLQRADFGEQPIWMTVTLAAMLGQIGLPGGGFGIGHGVNGTVGNMERPFRWGSYPQGKNAIDDFIPVAMISELLTRPNETYLYNGEQRVFPDIKLVWWAGGNPFHHHQDLNRLRSAFQMPQTIIVNDMNWTATARHADIVLPVAAPQERTDFGAGHSDNILIPMPRCVQPPGKAKTEYEIFTDLARTMGLEDAFTEGLDENGWLERIWTETRDVATLHGVDLPDWKTFLEGGPIELPDVAPDRVFLSAFRSDPVEHPVPTPSGRIELFSNVISSFDLDDCAGHAIWRAPREVEAGRLADFPFYLLSGQPRTRLHSQLDNGAYSISMKIDQREPVLMNPRDAERLGLRDRDVIELYNDRGSCLAGLRITDEVAPGCVFLWTGAWYDPDLNHPDIRDRHGNPNVLTHDQRTSSLAQGPASHSTLVGVRRPSLPPDDVTVHEAPPFATVQA